MIVTADEIPDPQKLDLWLTVNGVEKQRSNTAKMLFKVDELIADISQGITLEPGDKLELSDLDGADDVFELYGITSSTATIQVMLGRR